MVTADPPAADEPPMGKSDPVKHRTPLVVGVALAAVVAFFLVGLAIGRGRVPGSSPRTHTLVARYQSLVGSVNGCKHAHPTGATYTLETPSGELLAVASPDGAYSSACYWELTFPKVPERPSYVIISDDGTKLGTYSLGDLQASNWNV
jgi:hypothetical protein